MHKVLNHVTVPGLRYGALLDLAAQLGCVGVEVRNDLARPLFDGLPARQAGEMAQDRGLRLVGLSQVAPFNQWSAARLAAVGMLIDTAQEAGAETISLIPLNDGSGSESELARVLSKILPLLDRAEMTALIEPLGFAQASLRAKGEAVAAIRDVGGEHRFKLVHDTFHHALTHGGADGPLFPEMTGIVHVSGVTAPGIAFTEMTDAHRGVVDAADRLDSLGQIRALFRAGYDGPVSMECFAPETQTMTDPFSEIQRSFDLIASLVEAEIA